MPLHTLVTSPRGTVRLWLLAAWFLTAPGTAWPSGPAPTAPVDTLAVDLPDLVVTAAAEPSLRLSRSRLTLSRLVLQDPVSVADLGALLPSTSLAVTSRGETHAMVRGAPERHVQTFLDGIPLNIPWDERVDLATIPMLGIGGIEGRRGPATLLDGPGAIAGSVRLLPPPPAGPRPRTTLRSAAGSHALGQIELSHRQRTGAWDLLGAGGAMTRDGWRRPGGGQRPGSDARQWSLLLRGSRPVGSDGRLSLLATGFTTERGVPPEEHLGDAARFWRYPIRERCLAGASLTLPLDARGDWDLGVVAAVDAFHQEIDPRGPDGWGQPRLPGQDYEKNWDRTAHTRLRLTRWLSDQATVAVQTAARYTHHREQLLVAGPLRDHAQWLASVAVEGEALVARSWTLHAGLGWDHAATPEAGAQRPSEPRQALAAHLRLTHDLQQDLAVYLAAGRRSRFPSLRESYSGALGRFVVNPDLGPERQDQVELGLFQARGSWQWQAAAFLGRLTDGIEREAIDEGRFQRVNRGRIEVPGIEVSGTWSPQPGLAANWQHTWLEARVVTDGIRRPAEDRPAYLSRAELVWQPETGVGTLLGARLIGPRWSADSLAPAGLRRLAAGVLWDVRLSWRLATGSTIPGRLASLDRAEVFLRLDNLLDARVESQTGLPMPGRMLSGGVSLSR
jgi:iron complex outermembrane recepter protein